MKTDSFLRSHSRTLSIALVAIVLVTAAWLVDSLTAARVEQRISSKVESESRLAAAPAVFVGGMPFAQVMFTNKIPRITVDALDVDIKDLGIVNASTQIYNVHVPTADAYAGNVVGHQAELMKRTVSLDGVALGQFLDMTDLDISNPYDISPSGGVASEAQLSGTLPGMEEKSTVIVSLRLSGHTFRMEPIAVVSDAGDPERVREGYTLEFDTRDLPLAAPANLVQLSGGSIQFEAERRNFALQPTDLIPVETGDSEFTD